MCAGQKLTSLAAAVAATRLVAAAAATVAATSTAATAATGTVGSLVDTDPTAIEPTNVSSVEWIPGR